MLDYENENALDIKSIERAAKKAIDNANRSSGSCDIYNGIVKAIAAAIEEYDRQKAK